MGYGMQFPTHQIGGPKNVWDIRGYGLSHAWVMTGSTVVGLCSDFAQTQIAKMAGVPAKCSPSQGGVSGKFQESGPAKI